MKKLYIAKVRTAKDKNVLETFFVIKNKLNFFGDSVFREISTGIPLVIGHTIYDDEDDFRDTTYYFDINNTNEMQKVGDLIWEIEELKDNSTNNIKKIKHYLSTSIEITLWKINSIREISNKSKEKELKNTLS